MQKILNFSSDSELDLQSHSTTGEESSVELFSDVSGNGGDAHGTSGMEESSPVDTSGDDEESSTNEQPPPVDPPCPDDSVREGKSELVEGRTADSGNSDSSDDDDQFEEFLLSTRKTMEAKSAKKCSPQRLRYVCLYPLCGLHVDRLHIHLRMCIRTPMYLLPST